MSDHVPNVIVHCPFVQIQLIWSNEDILNDWLYLDCCDIFPLLYSLHMSSFYATRHKLVSADIFHMDIMHIYIRHYSRGLKRHVNQIRCLNDISFYITWLHTQKIILSYTKDKKLDANVLLYICENLHALFCLTFLVHMLCGSCTGGKCCFAYGVNVLMLQILSENGFGLMEDKCHLSMGL